MASPAHLLVWSRDRVEILPGVGVDQVKIGDRREDVFFGSRHAQDLDPLADDEDERAIVEGVSVAPYEYFVTG